MKLGEADMKGIKRQNYFPVWVAGAFFLIFLIAGFFYVMTVRERNRLAGERFLLDATMQRQAALNQRFEGDLQVLRGVAVGLSEMDIGDREKIFRILDTVNRGNIFVRMGLIDARGRGTLVDLDGTLFRNVNLSGMEFFRSAIQGRDAVSKTFYDTLTDAYVNYCAVPIHKDGEIETVLCAVNESRVLRDIVTTPVFAEEGAFVVLDERGIVVVPTDGRLPNLALGSDLYQIFDFKAEGRAAFAKAIAEKAPLPFDFFQRGEKYSGVLLPLDENDWYVASVVHRSVLDSFFNQTSAGITMLILAASVVFTFLMYVQFRMMAKNQRELERLAYTDLLTEARNYTKFLLDADAMLKTRGSRLYAIWNFDIRQFGRINELYGNAMGDKVLQFVASLFKADAGGGIFCRSSADQFVGIIPYAQKSDLVDWADAVFSRLARHEAVAGSELQLSATIGFYCVGDFEANLSVDNMVNRASVAKKNAKATAGSNAAFFTGDMGEVIRREAQLESMCGDALSNGCIGFFLQPKVAIQGAYRVAGAEALARWNDPTYGMVSPGEFIPLFERNGFVVTLDRDIFRQVCAWYAAWMKRGLPRIQISINVSRQGLLRDDFIAHYVSVKEMNGIPNGALELEFTESVVLDDYGYFVRTVRELQRAGFHCSIDDFGAGYSSLNVLKNLPVDAMKLDALFFHGSDDLARSQTVVSNFIDLAKKLDIQTVAEGVEKRSQVDFLAQAGCDLVQGYVFSKPIAPTDFDRLTLEVGEDFRLLTE